jgi:hypothetical protein
MWKCKALQIIIDQTELKNIDARCRREIKPRIAKAEAAFNRKTLLTSNI